ncbi:Hypothetical protein NTJ_08759 [Nesidiocoris tenuis]|uniref:Uncharacterized protein n=1 Tax=Nesidiocoris tenuis TaxID=355587 RepID=A0ABN7AUU3_9HEMI|nr:Hypothetical protein NTJ_08759 [Nesidiocoris tenuis]
MKSKRNSKWSESVGKNLITPRKDNVCRSREDNERLAPPRGRCGWGWVFVLSIIQKTVSVEEFQGGSGNRKNGLEYKRPKAS